MRALKSYVDCASEQSVKVHNPLIPYTIEFYFSCAESVNRRAIDSGKFVQLFQSRFNFDDLFSFGVRHGLQTLLEIVDFSLRITYASEGSCQVPHDPRQDVRELMSTR